MLFQIIARAPSDAGCVCPRPNLARAFSLALSALLAFAGSVPLRAEEAVPADRFVDSVGVNIHLAQADSVYTNNFPLILERLHELGVRHVRDAVVDAAPMYYERHNQLGATGIRGTFLSAVDQSEPLLSSFPARVMSAFEAYEAPAGYDTSGDPTWAANLRAFLAVLHRAANSSARRYPVIGPALSSQTNAGVLGEASAYFDYRNLQNYPGGKNPGIAAWGARTVIAEADTKPAITTETGYWMDPAMLRSVPADIAARYIPRLVLEQARAGIVRTFLYELADSSYRPSDGGSLGLLSADGSPKPAFVALSHLLGLLADPGAPFETTPMNYTMSGATPELHHLLLQRRDGSYYLALWIEAPAYDVATRQRLNTNPQQVSITTEPSVTMSAQYQLQDDGSLTMLPAWSSSLSADVQVTDRVTILKFQKATADANEVSAPQEFTGGGAPASAPAASTSPKALLVTSNPPTPTAGFTAVGQISLAGAATASPAKLRFVMQPSSALVLATLPPVSVAVEDANGNTVTSAKRSITLSLSTGSGLAGTLTTTAQDGIATFSNLKMSTPGSAYTLTAASSGLTSAVSAAFSISEPVTTPSVPARSADAFVDSVGVNVHFNYFGTVYTTQTPLMLSALSQLKIRHVRDVLVEQNVSGANIYYGTHNQLGSMGIKTDYILSSINASMAQVTDFPTLVNDMEAVEPANEFDTSGVANWAAEITAQQAALYETVRGSAAAKNLTVLGPSLAQPQLGSALGNLSSLSDAGNTHAYFGGWNPGNPGTGGKANVLYFLGLAEQVAPSKPVWATETGFWSALVKYWGGAGVGESLMAAYEPRALLEFWLSGSKRAYIYELADFADTMFFGLLRADGTAKPAFYAVSNLLSLLADPGPAFTPGSLSYSLSGDTSEVQQVLLQKRDGSSYLILWVEAAGMDASTLATIAVPQHTVDLALGRFPTALTIYQWTATGSTITTQLRPTQSVALSVGPNITIVKIQ